MEYSIYIIEQRVIVKDDLRNGLGCEWARLNLCYIRGEKFP